MTEHEIYAHLYGWDVMMQVPHYAAQVGARENFQE